MSEAAPLLLNMGADVAIATGLNPSSAQMPAIGNNDNEFAGVLQSVLNPASPSLNPDPLLAKQLQANPLLLAQLTGSANQLLLPDEFNLEALPDGNALPMDEPELAWQTLLAEYDSLDPDGASIVLASGDALGYQLQELTADGLKSASNIQDSAALSPEDLPERDPMAMSLEELSADNPANTSREPVAESPTAMASVHGQDVLSAAKPVMTAGDEEALSKVAKAQSAGSTSLTSSIHADVGVENSDAQLDTNHVLQEKNQSLAGHGKSDSIETLSNKFDSLINTASEQVSSVKPTTITGASAYATVSGLNSSQPLSSSGAPTVAQLTIPPQNPAWSDTVGERVQWMAAQNIQEAKIRLHPQELGAIEIRIQVGKDQQTTISFSSPHSQVRDALETAIPRLREMFGDSGLSLGDVNVSQHSSSQQGHADRDNKSSNQSQSPHSLFANDSADVAPIRPTITLGNGMLDLYA